MDAEHYGAEVLSILQSQGPQAVASLRALDAAMPATARAKEIIVDLGQEEDGTFGVFITLDGPDAYVLARAIKDCRTLFVTRFVDGRLHPPVPQFDPFDLPFGVNAMIVEAATIWLRGIWSDFGGTRAGLPVTIGADDGYGAVLVAKLAP